MSADKEPHYFSFNCYDYDDSTYRALWAKEANYLGESSTSYSKFQLAPDAPQRIQEASPEANSFTWCVTL